MRTSSTCPALAPRTATGPVRMCGPLSFCGTLWWIAGSAAGTVSPEPLAAFAPGVPDTVEITTVSPGSTVMQRLERGVEKAPMHRFRAGIQTMCLHFRAPFLRLPASGSSQKINREPGSATANTALGSACGRRARYVALFGYVTELSYKLVLVFIGSGSAHANLNRRRRIDGHHDDWSDGSTYRGPMLSPCRSPRCRAAKAACSSTWRGSLSSPRSDFGIWLSAAKAVGRRGGRLVLLNPNAAVAEVITTSGLTDLLRIERDGAPQAETSRQVFIDAFACARSAGRIVLLA